MTEAKNICIFGGSGHIGTAFIEKLLAETHHRIVIVDKVKPSYNLLSNSRLSFVALDFLESNVRITGTYSFLAEIDVVYFKVGLLGSPSISANLNYVDQYLEINSWSLLYILDACVNYGVERIVIDSSITAIASNSLTEPMKENTLPSDPLNLYSMSKGIMEDFARYLYRDKLKKYILRYPRVYIKGSKNVISYFIENVLRSEPIRIVGNPNKLLDFIHLDDVLTVNKLLIDCDYDQEVFHVSAGDPVTLSGLASRVSELMGYKDYPLIFDKEGMEPLEPILSSLDSQDSFAKLGLNKVKSLDDIIRDEIEFRKIGNE